MLHSARMKGRLGQDVESILQALGEVVSPWVSEECTGSIAGGPHCVRQAIFGPFGRHLTRETIHVAFRRTTSGQDHSNAWSSRSRAGVEICEDRAPGGKSIEVRSGQLSVAIQGHLLCSES